MREYGRLPISFEQRGAGEFVARGQGYVLDIEGPSARIAFPGKNRPAPIRMEFVNARRGAATPGRELPGKINYILGNNPKKWRLGLSAYERVTYAGIYPGVDVAYYGNQQELEFDLMVKPGAAVDAIRMRFAGAGRVRADASGNLVLGDVRLVAPAVIQGSKTIPCRYKVLPGGEVAFEVGAYDHGRALTIDPTLVYSTRLGGGTNGNQGNAIAIDGSGNAYIAGETNAADFPVVNPAFAGYQANQDGFVSKLNPDGTALMYSTYIGGSSNDGFSGIATDSTGAVWVAGSTQSPDFPLLTAFQTEFSGTYQDAVVVKLAPDGSLAYSTFLSGPNSSSAAAVAVDPFGNAYVTGQAQQGFPTTAGVYEEAIAGSRAGFVTKFSPTGSILWSTLLGGIYNDSGTAIAVDSFGNSYVAGYASSPSFPNAPAGGAQAVNNGGGDAFVAKLNFKGSGLLYFTFLGGTSDDQATGIGVDPVSGIATIAGWTNSTDFPVTAGVIQSAIVPGYHGFAAKLNAAGSAFLYATYLGGNRKDIISALAVDPGGNAYVAGYTDSSTFPAAAAIQPSIESNTISLFRTSDGGATWTAFDTNLPGAAFGLAPDPVNAGTVVASTDNGTFRSTNGGASWTQVTDVAYMQLARSPANPSVIYGVSGIVLQSVDNGVTWSEQGRVGAQLVADPKTSSVAYAFGSGPPVQKTVDNGVDWSPAVTGLPPTAQISAMAAGSDGRLYVGLSYNAGVSPGGIYRSIDHAVTWSLVYSGPNSNPFGIAGQGLVVAPSNPSVLYASDNFTLYGSTDGGTTWNTIRSLPGGTSSLAVSSFNPSVLYYGAYNSPSQMWTSTDGGVTWNPGAGLGVASANLIVADPANASAAYAPAQVSVVPFVSKLDAAGQNLLYSTVLGDYGSAYGIAANGGGDAFVTGSSWELPTTPSALQRNRNFDQNVLDAFVARISDATAACSYSVDPPQTLALWFTHLIQYVVTAPSGCPWTASSDQPWATIASGASGSGSGIVYVLIAQNSTASNLTANLRIGGQSVPLIVRPASCSYNAFSPDTAVAPGGGGSVQVELLAGDGCQWSLTNNDPNAITVVSGASGTGSGTVTMDVAPNLGSNERTFVIGTGQGGSETITQAGTTAPAVVATITSSPSGASIATIGAGCIPGTYTTPTQLTWNANTNCSIIFPTPQFIGGSQYVFQSAAVNGGPNATSNPLTVNSGTSPPTIAANFMAPCSYSLSPAGQNFTAQGGLGSFTVNSPAPCGWSAVSNTSWIAILSSGSQGTGKVSYSVAANSGGARSGSISVGGQNYNIGQAAFSCAYSISPSFTSIGDGAATVSVSVSAGGGCGWAAVSHAAWITVKSGGSSSGSSVVVLNVAANTGGQRSGTVTIAGKTFTVTQGAGACGAIDLTSQVAVSRSGLTFIPFSTHFFSQTLTVARGSTPQAPLYLVLVGMPNHLPYPNGVFLNGNQLTTSCFSAAGDYLIPVPASAQLGSVGVPLLWATQSFNVFFQYSIKVLQGLPSH